MGINPLNSVAGCDLILPEDFPTDSALFEYFDCEEKRKEAYIKYVGEDMAPKDIGLAIAVPVSTIRQWIVQGRWNRRLKAIREQREEEDRVALEAFRGDNRLEQVKADLAAGMKGREIVQAMLERADSEGFTPAQLKQLADALAGFTGVAARAVGVGETVESKGKQEDDAKAGKYRPPPVVINVQSGAQVTVTEGKEPPVVESP